MKNLSVKKVIEAFTKGEEAKTANGSLKSFKIDDKTLLIGYDWAVYAENWNGQFYIFDDWSGYSVTTSKHMGQLRYQAGRIAGPQGVCISCAGEGQKTLKEYGAPIPY